MVGILMACSIAGIWLSEPSSLNFLNFSFYDCFLERHHNTEKSNAPVIVNIDETSLRRFGQWPWPRYRIAAMVKTIAQAGPQAIGMDILFSEPDRTSPVRILSDLKSELGRQIKFSGLPSDYMDNDHLLADALAIAPAVIGSYCRFDHDATHSEMLDFLQKMVFHVLLLPSISAAAIDPKRDSQILIGDATLGADAGLNSPYRATGLIPPIDILAKAARGSGFINAIPDSDGVLRRMPLLIEHGGSLYPSLALALIQAIYQDWLMIMRTNSDPFDPEGVVLMLGEKRQIAGEWQEAMNEGKANTEIKKSSSHSDALTQLNIPLDSTGQMLIHFRGEEHVYPNYSAADVLDNKVLPSKFKDKIVLVGASAKVLQDFHATPLDREFNGVEVQAAVIDTVLSGDFIRVPSLTKSIQTMVMLTVSIFITIILVLRHVGWGLVFVLMASGGIFWATEYCFSQYQQFISPIPIILAITTHFFAMAILNIFNTERDKRFLKSAFSKFVAKPIVDQVVSSPIRLKLQGEDKKLSILFADIRNFTSLSENLSPEEVTQFLQEYFTPMTRVITQNNGTLDKFIGDGIMAFWNAPLDITGHERWAFDSAVGMLSQLGYLNKVFEKKYGFGINIGIGLHVGVVRVGNMGTEDLFNYTIIGDEVNVAARMESLTKFYGVRIIISEGMIPYVPVTHWIQDLDMVKIKGRQKPLKIYGLFSGDFLDEPRRHINEYHKALKLYRQKKFEAAHLIFTKFREKQFDRPLYKIYQERCAYFMEHPPKEDWDGVFVHIKK